MIGVHFAGGAEVKPQPEISLPGVAAEVDPRLPPRRRLEQLLNELVRIGRRLRRHRRERWQFSVNRVDYRARGVVRGDQLPGRAAIFGDEGPGAIPHLIDFSGGALGCEPIVEVERRLIRVGVASQTERVGYRAAVGTPRQVVVVANRRIGGKFPLPVIIPPTEHAVLTRCRVAIPNIDRVVGVSKGGIGDPVFQTKVHAGTTGGLVPAVAALAVDGFARKDSRRLAGVVRRRVHAVPRLAAAGGGEMPEIHVERGKCQPPGSRGIGESQVIRAAPRRNLQQSAGIGGVNQYEVAIVGQREELSAIQPVLEVLRGRRETNETSRPEPAECDAVVPPYRCVRIVVGRVTGCLRRVRGDLEQTTVGGHAIEWPGAILGELQTGHNRHITRSNRDTAHVTTLFVGETLIGGGIGTARRGRATGSTAVELR